MLRVVTAFATAVCLVHAGWQPSTAHAQLPGAGVAVAFRNDLKTPIIVQGHTVINGMAKTGQAMIILPGKAVAENNIPMGSVRFYTIVDANQPAQVHLRNFPVRVGGNDLSLGIRATPQRKVVLEQIP